MKIQDIKNNIKEAIEVSLQGGVGFGFFFFYVLLVALNRSFNPSLTVNFLNPFYADNSDSNGKPGTTSRASQSREPVSNRLYIKLSKPDRF